MSFRGRDNESGNPNKMDIGEPRRFGMDGDRPPMNDEMDDRRFDSGRGRRPPFGRGRRPSPPNRERGRDFGFGRDEPPMMRDRSPMRGADDRFADSGFMKRDDRDRREPGRPFFDDEPRDRFMDNSRLEGPGGFDNRFDGPGGDPYKSRPMNYPGGPPPKMFSDGFPKPNECEIIVVNKQQRAYAESVEARVKEIGLIVDVLFLKDEALLTQTIDDIARRGSLFAMVINTQNETHRSITVNILHGTPQEHRNMPLEDALKLLAQNFHKHIRMQRENMERERAERGPYVGKVSADREMQFLLRMIADGRWLSESELTAVIRYLTERRDKMVGGGPEEDRRLGRAPIPPANVKPDPPFKMKDDIDVARKEQDLQDRIMNIMNQGPGMNLPQTGANRSDTLSTGMIGSSIPGLKSLDEKNPLQTSMDSTTALRDSTDKPPFPSPREKETNPTPSTFINFGDPSVQKALDNLMQTGPNLLKNITSSLSNTSPSSILGNTANPPISSSGISSSNDMMGMQRDNINSSRGGMSDLGGGVSGNLDSRNMADLAGPRPPQRGTGPSDMMGGGQSLNRFGGMSDMGSQRDFNSGRNSGMPDSNLGRMPDMGRMGGGRGGGNLGMGPGRDMPPPRGMGNDFPGSNQFGPYKGPGGPRGNFSGGSFNSGPGGMGNMRQSYGGSQGMGGGPRRY